VIVRGGGFEGEDRPRVSGADDSSSSIQASASRRDVRTRAFASKLVSVSSSGLALLNRIRGAGSWVVEKRGFDVQVGEDLSLPNAVDSSVQDLASSRFFQARPVVSSFAFMMIWLGAFFSLDLPYRIRGAGIYAVEELSTRDGGCDVQKIGEDIPHLLDAQVLPAFKFKRKRPLLLTVLYFQLPFGNAAFCNYIHHSPATRLGSQQASSRTM